MFFEGSLQDGITTALQQSKLVMCLVTDDGEESQLWEADFLTDASLKERLETQAVVLRLQAGSQEAGYLEQLFPVPVKPTVVIIQNGQLKEYIAGGTPKDEFVRRAGNAMGDVAASETAPSSEERQPADLSEGQTLEQHQHHQESELAPEASASSTPPTETSQLPGSAQNARVQTLMAERAKSLDAEKKAQEAREKAEREERARARREAAANNDDTTIKPPERSHANEVRKQKQQAAEERRRILQRIEDDRREKKEQAAKDREARLLKTTQDPPITPASYSSKTPTASDHCSVQVRLLDGSSMRCRLASSATLATDVRPWVNRERTDGGSSSYTFRVVLSPLPNKAISPEEESSRSLEDLGLCPSATLVLVPKPGAFSSPAGGAGGGGGFFAYIMAALSFVWASILAFLGAGPAPASVPERGQFAAVGGGPAGASSSRQARGSGGDQEQVRRRQKGKGTVNDREGVDDAQLYNGNSLNFEPRRDVDDEDDSP